MYSQGSVAKVCTLVEYLIVAVLRINCWGWK